MSPTERRRLASQEAATWWVRLEANDLVREEREEFVDWLRESQVHVAEMLRIAKVHDALDQFQSWAQISTDGPDVGDENVIALAPLAKPIVPTAPRRRYQKRVQLGLLAAGLAALLAGGVLLLTPRGAIETDRGERREVALSDGSVLEVDPETRIRVVFEPKTRRVILERGRVLFRVAKNPDRPFLVQADGTTVRAVGTAFGVERQQKGVVVTVAEGKVGIYRTDAATAREPARAGTSGREAREQGNAAGVAAITPEAVAAPATTEIFLTAGQQVTLGAATSKSGSAESVRNVDSERELAWARGRLVFDNETVADAVAEFNRYNRVQLQIADQKLGSRTVSGVFDASDPESFISFLQTVTSIKVTRTESKLFIQ